MLVNEIFTSIEGEGKRTGLVATFIRLYGCNLRCKYCDSMYAVNGGKNEYVKMSVKDIFEKVKSLKVHFVTITGGEPLVQKDFEKLAKIFCENGFFVNVETNGSLPLKYRHKNLFYTMDWKSIYSGESKKMLLQNLKLLNENDVLKFVVANKKDLLQAESIVKKIKQNLKPQIYISSVFNKIEKKDIVEYIKQSEVFLESNVKFQLQIHKYIWHPEERGV